jgi:hypothetical protein
MVLFWSDLEAVTFPEANRAFTPDPNPFPADIPPTTLKPPAVALLAELDPIRSACDDDPEFKIELLPSKDDKRESNPAPVT